LDWAVAAQPLEADASGDGYVVVETEEAVMIAVLDGLGHGSKAAMVTDAAADVLRRHAAEPVVSLVRRCHQALHGSRGVAMSVASIDPARAALTWIAVGNVEGILVRHAPTSPRQTERIILRGGVVGYHLPFLQAQEVPIHAADVIALATDGLRRSFTDEVAPGALPAHSAHHLLARYGKGTDDALVLVARFRGAGT
jgi:serine phosphatase RsbU (regulator of sigma subunit)